VAGDDGPPVVAPGPQVDPRGNGLPAAQPFGLSDQGEGFIALSGRNTDFANGITEPPSGSERITDELI